MIVSVSEVVKNARNGTSTSVEKLLSRYRFHPKFELKQEGEDLFIDALANSKEVYRRIDDFIHLSYIRPGKLQLIFHTEQKVTALRLNNINADFLRLDDGCIKSSVLLHKIAQFQAGFQCEIIRRSGKNLLETMNQLDKDLSFDQVGSSR